MIVMAISKPSWSRSRLFVLWVPHQQLVPLDCFDYIIDVTFQSASLGQASISRASWSRSLAWKVGDKHPGF
ncbi:hypothetical protein HanRHA438_Chr17g0814421 [Helianthus annuus]|nr:hypothetical protein HanIR_Chr17g0872581 [Helianthus annuus]KAJ0447651.1 hypothetical protein HanHA89_Chr17g0707731 [Helianthus annuus]KAJ0632554.1 hypothetical protein HanLR1_Chr17g0666381 [Helianthus annuus]KAJ0826449.1 hypothetical protein HanRHA438_Chr17g0814421 [Helianthus annuus]